MLRYFYFAPRHAFGSCSGFAGCTPPSLAPVFPFPAHALPMRPHSSVYMRYRNLNLLSIGYVLRPLLRSRLTLGGRTFPRKPQTLDGEVSRLSLATYAGILSSIQSTRPYGHASARIHCSSTDTITRIPKLRCQVLAPVIFRASSLDQ